MKKTLLALLMLATCTAYAQNNPPSETAKGMQNFSCRHVEITKDNKQIIMQDDVEIKMEKLAVKADRAVFNEDTNTLVAYGVKEVTFSGAIVVQQTEKEKINNTIRYTLTDDTIYYE